MSVRTTVKIFRFLTIVAFALMINLPAQSISKETVVIGKSGYPVPRFVSLAKETVNVRTGPDRQYPIKWVFKRKGLPVKIIAEYGEWRKFIDSEGASGWIWGSLVSSRRTALVLDRNLALYESADKESDVTVVAEGGVIGRLLECRKQWCKIDIQGFKGWALRTSLWGTLEGEELD
ncbi:SH3 domain-containing protein [Emcibacter sp.]|uniref:SH3 domain-containing protein n=1 Tax=Emcibacter sp. TaxID=1979954 RepID=UPI002AA6CF23|nr:SH3 domain-containing protein [Emcibacter sp.]